MRTLEYNEAVSMVGKVPHLYSWHANDETLLGADVPARWGCKLASHLARFLLAIWPPGQADEMLKHLDAAERRSHNDALTKLYTELIRTD